MLDLIYDLMPGEDVTTLDGQMLVLLMGRCTFCYKLGDHIQKKVERLDDASEFQIAIVESDDFPELNKHNTDEPLLIHFLDGKESNRVEGIDDCIDFFDEFVMNNKCKKYGSKKRKGIAR
jgi:hypothetical protein